MQLPEDDNVSQNQPNDIDPLSPKRQQEQVEGKWIDIVLLLLHQGSIYDKYDKYDKSVELEVNQKMFELSCIIKLLMATPIILSNIQDISLNQEKYIQQLKLN